MGFYGVIALGRLILPLRAAGSMRLPHRLFLCLGKCGTALEKEFHAPFGSAHLNARGDFLPVGGSKGDLDLFPRSIIIELLFAQRVVLDLPHQVGSIPPKTEHLVGERILRHIARTGLLRGVVHDQLGGMPQITGRVQVFNVVGREFVTPELITLPQSPPDEMHVELDAAVLRTVKRELGIAFLATELGFEMDGDQHSGLPPLKHAFQIITVAKLVGGDAVTLGLPPVDLPLVKQVLIIDTVGGEAATCRLIVRVQAILDLLGGDLWLRLLGHIVEQKVRRVVELVHEIFTEVAQDIAVPVDLHKMMAVLPGSLLQGEVPVGVDAGDALGTFLFLVVGHQVTGMLLGLLLLSCIHLIHMLEFLKLCGTFR